MYNSSKVSKKNNVTYVFLSYFHLHEILKSFSVTVFFSEMKNLLNWAALTYLILTTSSATAYPDCADPSTYTSYGKSTEYKGLSDNIAWDRTLDSGDACDFSSINPPQQAQTCGDCDFDLEEDTWYRFDQGPYIEIAEYSDNSSCPARGHCNGFYQIALLSSDIDSGNVNSKKYYVVYSDARGSSNCTVTGDAFMVEEFYCDKFRLYKFPTGWKSSSVVCSNTIEENTNITLPTPYSLCMTDTVKELTLTANRKYFAEEDTLLTCTSEMSPKPPSEMTWKDPDDQDITSKATRDSTLSSLFKEVYNLSSSTLTSVTCQVDDKSHTFYQISIETENVTGIAGEKVTATCNFTLDEISTEDEEDIYFIEIGDDSEVFYNSLNCSSRGETWNIDKTNPGIYSVSITSVRTKSEEWKCGIRDPMTNVYNTVPFTITVINNDCDAGKGFPSDDSDECVTCDENTYSSENRCDDCPTGQVSGKGASRCFEIVAKDVIWSSSKKVNAICSVILPGFSEEVKSNLYMIQEKEGENVYYTETNITSGYKILVSEIGVGTYNMSLAFQDPSVPDDARSRTENWKCAVRDPETEIYTTLPFTVTFNKHCKVGTGFATPDSTECTECPENTFSPKNTYSSANRCEDCPSGQVSGKGASRCFEIVAKDVIWSSSKKVNAICSVILPGFSEEVKSNLYMIQEKEGENVYYTETNITSGYKILVSEIGVGTYNMSLAFQDPSVPDDARSRTENWKCAVRDPETEIYTTLPFTVTFNKHCKVGTGFVTQDSTECTECPENTFSSNNECEKCEEGQISQAGSDKCWDKPNPGAEFYVLAGVGGALLVILALMIAALIWNKRRQEQQNVIIANPTSNENGNRNLNVTVNISSNESKF